MKYKEQEEKLVHRTKMITSIILNVSSFAHSGRNTNTQIVSVNIGSVMCVFVLFRYPVSSHRHSDRHSNRRNLLHQGKAKNSIYYDMH